jgi:hypothetical protein
VREIGESPLNEICGDVEARSEAVNLVEKEV